MASRPHTPHTVPVDTVSARRHTWRFHASPCRILFLMVSFSPVSSLPSRTELCAAVQPEPERGGRCPLVGEHTTPGATTRDRLDTSMLATRRARIRCFQAKRARDGRERTNKPRRSSRRGGSTTKVTSIGAPCQGRLLTLLCLSFCCSLAFHNLPFSTHLQPYKPSASCDRASEPRGGIQSRFL